ncbi:MAG TPA: PRC-barrel domain-containing protein [Opitutus sp.]|nr:PRC-barrel domain-containing protein [Opitutus sp.]
MIHEAKHLEGYEIKARDGALGSVKDLYFDDQMWSVRYFVVATGSWLSGRKVLLSAPRLTFAGPGERQLSIDATQEQVRNSPSIDTDRPVSRQQEEAMHTYYGWPYYWGTAPFAGGGFGSMAMGNVGPMLVPPPADPEQQSARPQDTVAEERRSKQDSHLRSMHEVRGYRIAARDGSIGEIEDFLVDDIDWRIRFLVVDTRHWLPGRKVVVAPQWIQSVRWEHHDVTVDLSRGDIEQSPPYDPRQGITLNDADLVQRHYRRDREAP